MLEPLLSVCLVVYNQESFIKTVLEGILMQQTAFDFEIVIGEDCSSDTTRDICAMYEKLHPDKIKLLTNHGHNLGLNQNFLRTFRACRGKYIAYLEGDDYWITDDKLQKQVDILEKDEDIVLVHSNCKVWNVKNNTIQDHLIQYKGTCIREIQSGISGVETEFQGNFRHIKTSTCVYRKNIMEQILSEDEFAYANKEFPTQDFQLFLDMAFHGKFAFIDEDTTVIGLSDSISVNSNIDKNFNFKQGFFKIGLYYINKYNLNNTVTQPWFQKELHWFLNFAMCHSVYKDDVNNLLTLARNEGYIASKTQILLSYMLNHPFLQRLIFPFYRHYYNKRG